MIKRIIERIRGFRSRKEEQEIEWHIIQRLKQAEEQQ